MLRDNAAESACYGKNPLPLDQRTDHPALHTGGHQEAADDAGEDADDGIDGAAAVEQHARLIDRKAGMAILKAAQPVEEGLLPAIAAAA